MDKKKPFEPYRGLPPYQESSETSELAAMSMIEAAPTLELRVEAFIIHRGSYGATDEEVCTALKIAINTETARRRTLVLKGRVKDSGFCRRNRSKRIATVWVSDNSEPTEIRGKLKTYKQKYNDLLVKVENLESEVKTLNRENEELSKKLKRQLRLF